MKFLHNRFTSPIQVVIFHSVLIALEGIIGISALLVEPSQSGGFLGFSVGRWAILLANLVAVGGIFFISYRVNTGRSKTLELWLSNEKNLFRVFFFCILLFGLSFPSALGQIPAIRYFTYFGRIQPTLIWVALASAQIGLTLSFVLRQAILSWFRQFFPRGKPSQGSLNLTKAQRYIVIGITFFYLLLQLTSHLETREAVWLPDSIDYIFPATTYNWNELGLWTHTKPWGAAVLYKLTGSSPVVIDAVQTSLSSLAWLVLGLSFSLSIRAGWLKLTAFSIILGFSLAAPVQMWNHIILSESLSISLMVLILAVWLSLLQRWRWGKLFVLIILFGWWIGTRETNVYLSLLIAAILVPIGLFYKRQRFYWAVSILLALFCYINIQISELPTFPRWLYPLTNTVLNRILPSDEFLSYFEKKGMPVSPELLALQGGLADSDNFAVYNSPELNEMERWLYRKGKEVYVRFLIDHPVYTLISPWQHLKELLAPSDLQNNGSGQTLARSIGNLFFPSSLWLVALLVILALGLTLGTKRKSHILAFWLVLGFLALFFPHMYLVWHGDAAAVGRHAAQSSIQLRLALWLIIFLSLDKIIANGYQIRTRNRT